MAVIRFVFSVTLAVVTLTLAVGAQQPADWPQWRGPNRDGSAPLDAPQSWPFGLTRQWSVEVGGGYATPLVVGDRVYVFTRQGGNEVMSALDAATGETVWSTGYPASFEMHSAATRHGPGPKSTPVYVDGRLYGIGMTGIVTAYDAATGRQLWQNPGSGVVPLYTSHGFSPIVDGNRVIFHLGGHDDGALTALDVETGGTVWSWDGDGPGYGSPVIANIAGTRQVVVVTQGKVVGVGLAGGALLWEWAYESNNFTNSITPLVARETVIVAQGGGPAMALSIVRQGAQWTVETLWENDEVPMRMTTAVLVDGTLFGLSTRNSGQYFGLDPRTGETLWTSPGRQADQAALASAGDVLLSLESDGELLVLEQSRTGFEPVQRYQVAADETWTQAAYSGNRIFVKDVSTLTRWTIE